MPRFSPPEITNRRLTDLSGGEMSARRIRAGSNEWFWYARGYLDAANDIADHLAKEPQALEFRAAPMMFLYRHHIELHLKYLLQSAGELFNEPERLPSKHPLLDLWHRVRALLRRIGTRRDDAWFARADEIIAEFDSLDAGSFAWRYPVDIEGQPSLPRDFRVDPTVVRSIMIELGVLLEGASAQVMLLREIKQSLEDEAG